jgi:Contractile injection system tape measure protein
VEDQRHYIQKQKLFFDFPTEEKAIAWNRNASSFYYAEIVPLLNQLFNKYIPMDQVYLIDSLEIDLGKIHRNEVKETLLRKIETILHDILAQDENGNLLSNFLKQGGGLKPEEEITASHKLADGVTVKKYNENLLEAFYTFLDYGILTWNSNFDATAQLEEELLKQIGIERLAQFQDFKDRIKQALMRRRFGYQFSKPFVEQVFQKLLPEELEVIELFKSLIAERVETISIDTPSKNIIRKIISEETLEWIIASDSDDTEALAKDVIHAAITRIELQLNAKHKVTVVQFKLYNLLYIDLYIDKENKSSRSLNQVIKVIRVHPSYDRIIKSSASATRATSKGSSTERNQKSEKDKESGAHEIPLMQDRANFVSDDQIQHQSLSETNAGSREENIKTNGWGSAATPSTSEDLENARAEELKKQATAKFENKVSIQAEIAGHKKETISNRPKSLTEYYVLNAGIVLCWPYLNRLFERLGYLLSTDFRNPESQERAVHVLGYIASGHDNCEEHELTLAKLLTIWPLQMPLVKEMKLLKKEKRESDKMLRSLIVNWPILKNTSIDGLRSSFFQRDGKLSKEDEGWRLIVEQKSYDMLLDHMPYSIAVVKLPWSKEILKVDWA